MADTSLRIAVLAPIANSLYARLVTFLALQEPGVRLAVAVVRSVWNLPRIRSELRRDGARLLQKVYRKFVLGAAAYLPSDAETLLSLATSVGLPGKGLNELARLGGAPLLTVGDHNAPRSEAALKAAAPDVIVFTGGGLIRKHILDIPRLGVLNCHAGLLPRYRGMDVVEWPILEADDEPPQTGITVHFMDRGVDTGPILLRQPLEIRPGDTLAALRERLEPMQVRLMLDALRGLRDGRLAGQAQAAQDGRQYFVMHPRIRAIAAQRLALRKPVS